MPTPPAEPYIDIQTGFTSGTIYDGGTFNWYNSGGGSCTVGNVGGWCTQSSFNAIPAGGSASATVKNVTGSFSYSSACYQGNSPVVHINPTHPVAVKKTA